MLYSNAQSFGDEGVAYNYVYAAKLGTTAEIEKNNKAYEAVQDYLNEYSSSADAQALIEFCFRTDLTLDETNSEHLEIIENYDEKLLDEIFAKFAADGELIKENTLIYQVGKLTKDDQESIEEAWYASLPQDVEAEEEEDESLPTWAIVLISVGSAVIVGAAAVVVVLYLKKKKEKKLEEEATVNAYKRKKIDTTDDKSIDVYADEEENATPAETSEE